MKAKLEAMRGERYSERIVNVIAETGDHTVVDFNGKVYTVGKRSGLVISNTGRIVYRHARLVKEGE